MAINGPVNASYDGFFKTVYGDIQDKSIPEIGMVRERVKFRNEERLGDIYMFPVRTKRSHGWTFASPTTSSTAFALNAAKSGEMKNAQIRGASFVCRDQMATKAVLSATEKGENAFGNLFDEAVEDVYNTTAAMLEISLLYGGRSLGAAFQAGSSAASVVHPITAASSSLGMWGQLEGAYVDVYDPTLVTKRNTTGDMEVTYVDWDATNQRVNVTLAAAAADNNAVQAGDVFVPKGANGAWFSGIDAIAANTGSLFNIDAAAYSVWKANSQDNGGASLNFLKLTSALGQVVSRSGVGPLTALVSVPTWSNLNNNWAAIRRDIGKTGSAELGAKSITYNGATGQVEIVAHPFVKGGEAFILDFDQFRRVGASDISWDAPVEGLNQKYLHYISGQHGFEFRMQWDQALICRKPRSLVRISNIVNSL